MFTSQFQNQLSETLEEIKSAGLYKSERKISSAQDAEVTLEDGRRVINMCANNYLGLSNHPEVREAARSAISDHGFGLAGEQGWLSDSRSRGNEDDGSEP